MQLDKLFRDKIFITDLGMTMVATVDGEEKSIGRYAVFAPCQDGEHHQPVETGSGLEHLQKKYDVPNERVCRLAEEGAV